jgi:hypothetical protein
VNRESIFSAEIKNRRPRSGLAFTFSQEALSRQQARISIKTYRKMYEKRHSKMAKLQCRGQLYKNVVKRLVKK